MISPSFRALSPIAQDVYDGLTSSPKRLPAKLFYDATGSALFEEITRLPEYYLTRTEAAILERNAGDMCEAAGAVNTVVEIAAGSANKTQIILAELLKRRLGVTYVPLDVSPAALTAARASVERRLPQVRVRPELGEMNDFAFFQRYAPPRMVLFIGSTIGNLEDGQAVALLRAIGKHMHSGDCLVLGADQVKPQRVLVPAYNDASGVTARFNLNILRRVNRELGGTFDTDSFRHIALWNAHRSRIEMHLQSVRTQVVTIKDISLTIRFGDGETIHTENSYKYTVPRITSLLHGGAFRLMRTWTDTQSWYGVHLARLA